MLQGLRGEQLFFTLSIYDYGTWYGFKLINSSTNSILKPAIHVNQFNLSFALPIFCPYIKCNIGCYINLQQIYLS